MEALTEKLALVAASDRLPIEASTSAGQPVALPVRHDHIHGGGAVRCSLLVVSITHAVSVTGRDPDLANNVKLYLRILVRMAEAGMYSTRGSRSIYILRRAAGGGRLGEVTRQT